MLNAGCVVVTVWLSINFGDAAVGVIGILLLAVQLDAVLLWSAGEDVVTMELLIPEEGVLVDEVVVVALGDKFEVA